MKRTNSMRRSRRHDRLCFVLPLLLLLTSERSGDAFLLPAAVQHRQSASNGAPLFIGKKPGAEAEGAAFPMVGSGSRQSISFCVWGRIRRASTTCVGLVTPGAATIAGTSPSASTSTTTLDLSSAPPDTGPTKRVGTDGRRVYTSGRGPGPGPGRGPGRGPNRGRGDFGGRGQWRQGGGGGRGGEYRGRGGRGNNGPMGGAPPVLKLKNPLKVQIIVQEEPEEEPEDQPDSGLLGRGSPAFEASTRTTDGPIVVGDDDEPAVIPIGKPKPRSFDARKRKGKNYGGGDDDDDGKPGFGRGRPVRRGRPGGNTGMKRRGVRKRDRAAIKLAKQEAALERKTVDIPETPISVGKLAEIIDERPIAIIKLLMTDLGVMASVTQNLDPATCIAVAEGFGKIIRGKDDVDDDDEDDELEDEDEESIDENSAVSVGFVMDEDDPDDLIARPPVVTIMGHVDHGKTSLLDAIRHTRVTAGEAGGITQHIAAYQVEHNNGLITFIDTPGHAAFTDMRERGANITDMVILVVAADDGVKQQTADSIACARQAGVPLIVAINKIDLETADPNRVLSELTTYDVLTEDLGGNVLCTQISAKENLNLDDLLDKIELQAEVGDLKANPKRDAQGVVIEAKLERGLGSVATTLIQRGTLRIGDNFVAGASHGKVRALILPDGKTRVKEVGPSTPIGVVGFEGLPAAGDILAVVEDEQTARELAENRQRIAREKDSSSYQSGLMSSVAAAFAGMKVHREMVVVVKADVQGSAEALTRALTELRREDDEAVVTVKVLVSEAGEVTKSDIAIASVTPGTTVLAFGVAATFEAMEEARSLNIPIEYYNIVYDAIDSVESRMQEVLSPTPDGEFVGAATVQEIFDIGGVGNIAGSRCTEGFLRKGANVRVMRGDKILVNSKIKSLRNFKAEVDRIEEGNECGIGLVDFEEYEVDDIIECYVEQ